MAGPILCPYCEIEVVRKEAADVLSPAGVARNPTGRYWVCPECKARAPVNETTGGLAFPIANERTRNLSSQVLAQGRTLAKQMEVSNTYAIASAAVEAGVRESTKNVRLTSFTEAELELVLSVIQRMLYEVDLAPKNPKIRLPGEIRYLFTESQLGGVLQESILAVASRSGLDLGDSVVYAILAEASARSKPYKMGG